ncbi:uncharacterized protein MCYG_07378 [Microsporum canis CBS 113480]|uniref:Uncharacterized protein n=1 Tax=Arthroderma otae (strain ATCC MYA-4605 / CBS 113480) TaxID=554155 RepID=C5FYG1_ARTOC|nr:uncharacterized protein MCYG_07378 [Microsporum canis CBS 113480]EEQ34559.1 predicted protein [Microsporum canis CBS 113480]
MVIASTLQYHFFNDGYLVNVPWVLSAVSSPFILSPVFCAKPRAYGFLLVKHKNNAPNTMAALKTTKPAFIADLDRNRDHDIYTLADDNATQCSYIPMISILFSLAASLFLLQSF